MPEFNTAKSQARQIADNGRLPDFLEGDFAALKALIANLKREKRFPLARRVAEIALVAGFAEQEQLWLHQQTALCIYKDEEIDAEQRFDDALIALLGPNGRLAAPGLDAETLSLAGAIHKRRWETGGQRGDLEQTIVLYGRAREAGKAANNIGDWTCATINAALACELLADEIANNLSTASAPEEIDAGLGELVASLRTRATEFRREILANADSLLAMAEGCWWGSAILAEAYLGLGQYDAAEKILREAKPEEAPEWERESTARQLAQLAKLRSGSDEAEYAKALAALSPIVPEMVAKALAQGPIGLALSGGGYRASFFHVGVLARLAELDLLRWVDTLSCVSGGSITGALYYLLLRDKLQRHKTLNRGDYIACVEDVAALLLKATGGFDLRTRALIRFLKCPWGSSWTEQIGCLLESSLFHPAMRTSPGTPIPLTDLMVTPKADPAGADFNPRLHNWRRADRVPMLVLNATTLNTGHNWQFTASWAGESPVAINARVDALGRLRRFYHTEPTAPTHDVCPSLGKAVAASACVPIFPPINLGKLYPDLIVRLADGGVHDNQGMFSLVEQGCRTVIVSDGSGQLRMQNNPSRMMPCVLKRSNDVLMQADRRFLFEMVDGRCKGRGLLDLRYIHMKQGIEQPDVTWTGGPTQTPPPQLSVPGLNSDVQRILADTRTDLDLFPETLGKSLMYAGYMLADRDLGDASLAKQLGNAKSVRHDWLFNSVAGLAASPTDASLQGLGPRHGLMVRGLISIWNELKEWWR